MKEKDRSTIRSFLENGNGRRKGFSDTTKRTYRVALYSFLDFLDTRFDVGADGIDREKVQAFVDYLSTEAINREHKKGLSPYTIAKNVGAIKSFLGYIGKEEEGQGLQYSDPPNQLNLAPRSLSRNEIQALLLKVVQDGDVRNIAIVMVLLNTGIRVTELVNIDLSQVKMETTKGKMVIHGKGGSVRVVQLSRETRKWLQTYLNSRKDSQPALFLSRNTGKRITTRGVQYMLEKYGIHPHRLRHTFITRHVRDLKTDYALIQQLTGHQSVDMIARYAKSTEEERQQAQDQLDNYFIFERDENDE